MTTPSETSPANFADADVVADFPPTALATTPNSEPSLEKTLGAALTLDWEKAAYVVLVILGFATRFYDLGARVMSHDESLHTQFAWYLFQGRGFSHSPMMHGPLRFEVTAFMYWLLGDNDYTSRIIPALLGVLSIAAMYWFRKWLGKAGALIAATMLLISPYMLYYSRYIRDEPFVIFWGILIAYGTIRYLEGRETKYLYMLTAVSALFYATMETSFIYIAITMLFLGVHLARELIAARWSRTELHQPFKLTVAITLIAGVLAIGAYVYWHEMNPPVSAEAADAGATTASPLDSFSGQLTVFGGAIAGIGVLVGVLLVFMGYGEQELRRYPALDLIVLFSVFVLPQLTAFPVRALGRDPIDYVFPAGQGLGPMLSSNAGVTTIVLLVMLSLSAAIGWYWNSRVFGICAGIFYGLYIPLFTTFFTNGNGIATGMVGSLGYWVVQQGVKRGGQPWYYYPTLHLTLYEFLPTIGAFFTAGLILYRWIKNREEPATTTEAFGSGTAAAEWQLAEEAAKPKRRGAASEAVGFPVIGYFAFWAVFALIAFTIAGEKMPWLTTHISLPLILVSGWGLGQFIDATDWSSFRARQGWLAAVVLPLTVIALLSALGDLLGARPPFQGNTLEDFQATFAFISAVIVTVIGGSALSYLAKDLTWNTIARFGVISVFGLLAVLTARVAFVATYINYDAANEFMVYAHGARGVKTVLEQLEDISERTTDGMGLKVAYDDAVSWPMTWYLRNFKNQAFYGATPTREALDAPAVIAGPAHWSKAESILGDRYYKFEYIRMVWPMQDYFPQTDPATGETIPLWTRIQKLFSTADYRQAMWDIWFSRDYTKYGQITSQNFDLSQWPVAERMRLYVRKDIAAQIWSYGVGPTALAQNTTTEDPYAKGKQDRPATRVWGSTGVGDGQFNGPRGLDVAPDGTLLVADSRNHRIQRFDSQGNFKGAFGTFGKVDDNTAGPNKLNEPWDLGVGPDGSVYVVDTWNHRIQKFDAEGNSIRIWGKFGQAETFDALWGPRALAFDSQGRIFVTDTGNKRIVIFNADGTGVQSIGGAGLDPGLFDEPVGIAIGKDDTLYVADTWNQRIQVLQKDAAGNYTFLREWPITGWYGQSLDNKPYIAVDAQERIYVTDPEGYRVLVFDAFGKFITTWGDFGNGNNQFALASGIAVDNEGQIYVSDVGENNRIMLFPAVK